MINDNDFKKTENRLYQYYKYKKKLIDINEKITLLKNQIKSLENAITNTDVTVIDYYKTSEISERVQTSSSNCGYVEQQMIREISLLEREQLIKKKRIVKLTLKKQSLEEYILTLEKIFNELTDNELKFIKYKYKLNYPILEIYKQTCQEFMVEQATYYVMRKKIVEKIYNRLSYK
ncbi:hypothetical protein [Clostridium butyricum]|uniref:hypothetical protein n=1 Tax=Clostridium butyricum TaxID=1492 RepID=UPI0012B85E37|nr:hypothetical protein [Clostridium butyricum]